MATISLKNKLKEVINNAKKVIDHFLDVLVNSISNLMKMEPKIIVIFFGILDIRSDI